MPDLGYVFNIHHRHRDFAGQIVQAFCARAWLSGEPSTSSCREAGAVLGSTSRDSSSGGMGATSSNAGWIAALPEQSTPSVSGTSLMLVPHALRPGDGTVTPESHTYRVPVAPRTFGAKSDVMAALAAHTHRHLQLKLVGWPSLWLCSPDTLASPDASSKVAVLSAGSSPAHSMIRLHCRPSQGPVRLPHRSSRAAEKGGSSDWLATLALVPCHQTNHLGLQQVREQAYHTAVHDIRRDGVLQLQTNQIFLWH